MTFRQDITYDSSIGVNDVAAFVNWCVSFSDCERMSHEYAIHAHYASR